MRRAIVLLALWGCGTKSRSTPYVVERSVCIEASQTVEGLPADEGIAECRAVPYKLVAPKIEGMCGPCGFSFDKATTLAERKSTPTACCYKVESPPPPPR